MRISIRIIGVFYLASGFISLGLFLKYLYSPGKNLLGDVFMEDMLWFIPSYLLLCVGLLSFYKSKISLKIAAYIAFLVVAPSVILLFAYLGRHNEFGFGGALFFTAIGYGIPIFIISSICAFLLNRESNMMVEDEKVQNKMALIVMLSTGILAVLLSVYPVKRVVADEVFRANMRTAKSQISLGPWEEKIIDETQPLNCKGLKLKKKIKIYSQLNVPEGQYQFLIAVKNNKEGPNATFTVGEIREPNVPKVIITLDDKPVGSWYVDQTIGGGNHQLTVEMSPCFGWLNNKGDTVTGSYNFLLSLYPSGAYMLGYRNELLSKSRNETGQHYTSKEYLLNELQ